MKSNPVGGISGGDTSKAGPVRGISDGDTSNAHMRSPVGYIYYSLVNLKKNCLEKWGPIYWGLFDFSQWGPF